MRNEARTAWVLAGAGELGAVQVGMLQALAEADWRADFVVGASAGAINGCAYAWNPTPEGTRELEAVWEHLTPSALFPLRPWHWLLAAFGRRSGLFPRVGLERVLRARLGGLRIEGGDLPCHVVASDATSGESVVLSEGPGVAAILASTAMPGLFEPVELGGRCLVDGGLASKTPLRVAAELGAERILLLPGGCRTSRPQRGVGPVSLHALNLLIARRLLSDLRDLACEVEVRVVPPLRAALGNAFGFSYADALVRSAKDSTWRWLDEGGLDRFELPRGLLAPDEQARELPLAAFAPLRGAGADGSGAPRLAALQART